MSRCRVHRRSQLSQKQLSVNHKDIALDSLGQRYDAVGRRLRLPQVSDEANHRLPSRSREAEDLYKFYYRFRSIGSRCAGNARDQWLGLLVCPYPYCEFLGSVRMTVGLADGF